jgi:protein PhnA
MHEVIFAKKIVMSESAECPKCKSPYGYPTGTSMMCPECGHEWSPTENSEAAPVTEETDSALVKDANGNVLQDGDTVVLIKDLPVKGAPKPIKAGTKVKNIKLTDGDHNIDCKIDGFGAMALKSIYVRKG